jgi:SEC-C motif domain protein
MNNPCFCSSNLTFENCCKLIIEGTQKASTAEALMRSRYSAYVTVATQYLLDSTHISERASYSKTDIETWAKESSWQKLEIIACKNGLEEDSVGEVEFKAYFKDSKNASKVHHEQSVFQKENGIWYFVSGEIVKPKISSPTTDRNAPCPCGSGKKFKKCCG